MNVLPCAGRAGQFDFAAQQRRQFAADGETQTGSAVFAAGAGIGLLERFEDELLFFGRDADSGIADRNGHRALSERAAPDDPSDHPSRDAADRHRDMTLRREFEGIRQQVLQDLLQPFRVGRERRRQRRIDIDAECQVLGFRNVMERPFDAVPQRRERDLFGLDRNRAGFDFRQIQNIVDEREQVRSGRVDVLGEIDLFRRESCLPRSPPAAGRESESNSAACAIHATCLPGTRTCTSR